MKNRLMIVRGEKSTYSKSEIQEFYRFLTFVEGNFRKALYIECIDGNGYAIHGLYIDDSTATYVGLFGRIGLSAYVKNLGIEDSYINATKSGSMAGAFAGGNADYVTLFEPTASMTEAQGKGYIVASVGEASGDIPYTAYFAKKSYIQNNSDIIQGFTNAVYKGEVWVKEHTAREIAEKIVSFFPDTDLDMLTNSIQRYKDIDAWNETPVLEQEAFDRLQTVMQEAGELKEKAPYEVIVNNDFAKKAINK